MPSLTGRHLIAGTWTRSEADSEGLTYHAVNPATGEALEPKFHEAGAAEVDAALQAAAQAAALTAGMPGSRWADLLSAIAAGALAREDTLIERAGLETGLPQARLKGELARTTGQLHLFAQLARDSSWVDAVIDTADPGRQPIPKPDIRRMRRPIGPVVIFDASNFPFAFGPCGGDTASALAAGNPVIVKAHPGHPGVDEIFADAVLESLKSLGLPAGLFSLLHGASPAIGGLLVRHPHTESVGFTGSQQGGRALFDIAAARTRPIPVFAEMGSINPLVLLPGAVQERGDAIADGLAGSITLGGGQFCTKPGLILCVDDANSAHLAERLGGNLAAAPAATLLNAGIRDRLERLLTEFREAPGVEARVTGASSGAALESPSLSVTDSATWRVQSGLHRETFGPAALLVHCTDVDDLISVIEGLEGQLTGTLHTGEGDSEKLVRRTASALTRKVGRLVFNGYPTGVEVNNAMVHGGPYPATTAAGTTSVGAAAIERFARSVAFQNAPDAVLPTELQNANPLGLIRRVNGKLTPDAVGG